ncbi:MAG: hypothetical protein R3277_07920 [Brumimicrobium sp.]|nr:hypothetical protein [Brumimicrobium sp.]
MEHKIKLKKTYRYFTYGNPETATNLWIVLHGYGQLAFYFLKKFNSLDPDKHFVVAPEGLHRFYIKGSSGRVGASWMTKESRLDDIEDNHRFLSTISRELTSGYTFKQKILLGFSQGAATASRWQDSSDYNADILILWAGVFPPDLKFDPDRSGLSNSKNIFVLGKQDPYFENQKNPFKEVDAHISSLFEIIHFDGGHDIDSSVLKNISDRISH